MNILGAILSLVRYGRPDDNGGLWWLHTQRESAIHGRAWLNFGHEGRTSLRFSWNLWDNSARIGFDVDDGEAEVGVFFALPPVAFFLTLESWPLLSGLVKRTGAREVRLAYHDGCVWWKLWADPNSWSSSTPRWRDGSFSLEDFFLGKETYLSKPVGTPVDIIVPMPEGTYAGTCQMTEDMWSRPRWPAKSIRRAKVDMVKPVPFPGKGESAHDCDEDALCGWGGPARSPADAVGEIVASVLRNRERHGGRNWQPEAQGTAA